MRGGMGFSFGRARPRPQQSQGSAYAPSKPKEGGIGVMGWPDRQRQPQQPPQAVQNAPSEDMPYGDLRGTALPERAGRKYISAWHTANRPQANSPYQSYAQAQQPASPQAFGMPGMTPGGPGRQQPFTSQMTDGYGNPTNTQQFYGQQQDMIRNLLQQLGQQNQGTYLGQGSPSPSFFAPPQFDLQSMWGQAAGNQAASPWGGMFY